MKWERGEIGYFYLEAVDGYATAVVRRRTMSKAALIISAKVDEWVIECNWCEQQCALAREVQGMQTKCLLNKPFNLDDEVLNPGISGAVGSPACHSPCTKCHSREW